MKKILILLLIFLSPVTCFALIGVGTSVRGASFSTTNTLTWTGPTVTGSNTFGIVNVSVNNNSAISGVTWGGVAMTEVTGAANTLSSPGVQIKTYYVLNPASAASIVLSATGNWNSSFSDSVYFTGVEQTIPVDVFANNQITTTGTSLTTTAVTTVNKDWGVLFVGASAGTTAASTNTTQRVVNNTNTNLTMFTGDTNADQTPAGSYSMAITNGNFAGPNSFLTFISPASQSTSITYDNSTDKPQVTGFPASITYSHTVGAGSNRILFVSVATTNGSTVLTPSVTYAGIPMTEVGTKYANSGYASALFLYELIAPTTGANNVVVTMNTAASASVVASQAISYFGVNQSNPIDTSTNNTGASGTSFSGTLTTNNANEYVIDNTVQDTDADTHTATSPSVKLQGGNTGITTYTWGDSYQGNIASASTVTMAWTATAVGNWKQGIIAIEPVPAVVSATTYRPWVLMGGTFSVMGGTFIIQ